VNGEIPLEPWNIANVYGFKFKTDIAYLREAVLNDLENQHGEYSNVDPELLKYLKIINISTIADVKKLYDNIEDLRVFLDTSMRLTQDLKAYNAYKKLYDALLVTTDMEEVYQKNDGSYAHTFMELLEDRRPDLAEVVRTTEEGSIIHNPDEDADEYITTNINAKLNRTLDILSEVSEGLSDLRFANEKSEIVNNIEKVVNQMKSYTVDMQAAGILYIFNDPHMCMLKILDYMKVSGFISPDDGVDLLIEDVISTIRISNKYSDKILHIIDNEGDISVQALLKDMLQFMHRIQLKVSEVFCDKPTDISDTCSNIYKSLVIPGLILSMQEFVDTDVQIKFFEHLGLNNIHLWNMIVNQTERSEISIYDTMSKPAVAMMYMMTIALKDVVIADVKAIYKDAIELINKIWKMEKKEELGLTVDIIDILGYDTNTVYDMSKKSIIRDFLTVKRIFKLEDYIWLRNKLLISKNISAKLAIDILDSLGILARDAINQGIIMDEDFDTSVRIVIPSYLNLVNKLNIIKTTDKEEEPDAILYKLFNDVLGTNLIHTTVDENIVIKDAEGATTATMIIKDKAEVANTDNYLQEIQTPSTNILSRALAGVRTETRSLSNDVLGVVYGLDGSVEYIGRNKTLEADNNSAPKGLNFRDVLTINRN
jgi:hypothetical protein